MQDFPLNCRRSLLIANSIQKTTVNSATAIVFQSVKSRFDLCTKNITIEYMYVPRILIFELLQGKYCNDTGCIYGRFMAKRSNFNSTNCI